MIRENEKWEIVGKRRYAYNEKRGAGEGAGAREGETG